MARSGRVLSLCRSLVLLGVLGSPETFPATNAAINAAAEDARLATFFREHLDAQFALRPTLGSSLGDRRFDGQLEDLSLEARRQWLRQARESLDTLPRRVAYQRLTRQGQVDYQILQDDLRAGLWNEANFDRFAEDPRVYNEYISGGVFTILTQSTLPREVNISNALARIRQVPKVIAAARSAIRNPPLVHTQTAIAQNRGALAFYESGLFELVGDSPQRPALQTAAAELLPVLRDYQDFLEHDLLPRAKGEWRSGRRRFQRKFELETDAGIDATRIYADAQREFERVRDDMYVLSRQLWSRHFPHEPLPADAPEGRRLTTDRVLRAIAQDHGQPESIVEDARRTVDQIRSFIVAADILHLPNPDRCQVIEMPEFQRGNSTAYMNSPPPLDPAAIGYYAVSPPPRSWDESKTRSYLEEYNRHMLQVLTIHEAYPGHYVQLEYANRNPSLLRKVLGSGVYIEGWAVYTEQMMLDQGYGQGDLALRLSQLKFYLRAVANAILDHRMHCESMTDDEAMDLLVRQSFQSEGEARLKVIRSKQSCVQLSTYFTGRMAHYRLRQAIQAEMGEAFNLGRYHEAVLENGSVPVKFLPELVRARLGLPAEVKR